MTLKNSNFSIFFMVFSYNSKNKGERQKWNYDSDSTSKNTSIKIEKNIFYMTLKWDWLARHELHISLESTYHWKRNAFLSEISVRNKARSIRS